MENGLLYKFLLVGSNRDLEATTTGATIEPMERIFALPMRKVFTNTPSVSLKAGEENRFILFLTAQ